MDFWKVICFVKEVFWLCKQTSICSEAEPQVCMWTKWWHHSFMMHIVHGKWPLLQVAYTCYIYPLYCLEVDDVGIADWVPSQSRNFRDGCCLQSEHVWCELDIRTSSLVTKGPTHLHYLWSTSSALRLFGGSVSRLLIRLVSDNFSVSSLEVCGSKECIS